MNITSKRKLLSLVAALAIALSIGGGLASDASADDTVSFKVDTIGWEPIGDTVQSFSVTWCRNC